MTACAEALSLPEVLETILLYLPLGKLIRAPFVCKAWKALVKDSPSIQQALFFQGEHGNTVEWFSSTDNVDLRSIFHPDFDSGGDSASGPGWKSDKLQVNSISPVLNPLCKWYFRQWGASNKHNIDYRKVFDTVYDPAEEIPPHLALYTSICEHPSWMSMSLMQPPCRQLYFRCRTDKTRFVVKAEDGQWLTLGLVLFVLAGHWLHHPDCEVMQDECCAAWEFSGGDSVQVLDFKVSGWSMLDLIKDAKAAGKKVNSINDQIRSGDLSEACVEAKEDLERRRQELDSWGEDLIKFPARNIELEEMVAEALEQQEEQRTVTGRAITPNLGRYTGASFD